MKKKYLDWAFNYALAGMAGGVFYREFTKWNGFTGTTALGKVHTHLFILGTFVFLLVALFTQSMNLEQEKKFQNFLKVYNIGLPILAITLLARGVVQVLGLTISKALDACLSGVAGLGHILVGVGIVLFLLSLKQNASI